MLCLNMLSLIVGLVMVGLAVSAPSPGIFHGGLAIPAATSYRYINRNTFSKQILLLYLFALYESDY